MERSKFMKLPLDISVDLWYNITYSKLVWTEFAYVERQLTFDFMTRKGKIYGF